MKQIGKTFADELKAAGLLELPFTWQADGTLNFDDRMTDDQRTAVRAVYDAHDPASVPTVAVVTPLQFIERFTQTEQLAIVIAAMSNAELRLWYDKLMAAQEVVFTDPRLSAGLDALVAAGLITTERKAELLVVARSI